MASPSEHDCALLFEMDANDRTVIVGRRVDFVLCKNCVYLETEMGRRWPWWCGNRQAFDTEDGTGVRIEDAENGCLRGKRKRTGYRDE